MRALVTLALLLLSSAAMAANFGDEVAACVVKKGQPYGEPMKSGAFLACEKEVEASRAAQKSPAIDRTDVFLACLRTSAAAQDDRISTASDIALAAAASCSPQWLGGLVANGESVTKMDDYPSSTVKTVALQIVLEVRKSVPGTKR